MTPLQLIVLPGLELAFGLAADLVRPSTFFKTESNAGTGLLSLTAVSAAVQAIVLPYHASDIDGSAVLYGDEKCLVRAAELAGIASPGPGDYLVDTVSGLRRQVLAARLDPTGAFWTFQARRCGAEDWGNLTAAASAEDWGGLSATPRFDDLQN